MMRQLLLCLLLPFALLPGLAQDTPPAEEAILYYDGSSESYFDCDGGWEYPKASLRWKARELRYQPGDSAVEFYQEPLVEGVEVDLNYWRPEGIDYRPRVVFRMRNLGKAPLVFRGSWMTSREGVPGTSRWYAWYFPERRELPADGEWHELVFQADASHPSEGNGEMPPLPVTKPFGFFHLSCEPLPAGVTTHFQLSQIRGEENPGERCRGVVAPHAPFPGEWSAGKPAAFPAMTVDFPERIPGDGEARLVLRPTFQGEEWPALPLTLEKKVEEGGRRWRIPAQSILLTPFLLDGEYRAVLECGEASLAGEASSFTLHIAGRKDVEFPAMSVKPFGGRPTIWKGNAPMTGAMRATYTTEGPAGIQYFSQAGVKIFGFCSTPTEGAYNLEMLTEYAPGKYNYSQFDRRMRNVLSVNPQAMVVVRLYLHAPRWWSRQHPQEMVRFGVPEEPEANHPYISFNGRPAPSWASLPWREYTVQGLKKMMEFLAKTPYADHLAGFVLASGQTEEWMEWGLDDVVFADYSPASEKGFRRWLKGRYGTDQALQRAWGDPDATLEGALQPSPRERSAGYPGTMLQEMPGARRIADYNRYHGENVAECIREFCRAIKEATGGRLLVGAFYGYMNELAGNHRLLLSGHLGVESLLEAPEVDFLCSPTGYAYRQEGGRGFPYAMGAVDSLQLHNKFWFVENDMRTHAAQAPGYGSPDSPEGDARQQIKESMHSLLTGMAQWWFDVGYIPFTGEPLAQAIRDCVRIMEETTLRLSREPVAQVAVLLDEESLYWTTLKTPQASAAIRGLQRTLGYLGAPVEVYLTPDLERLPQRIRLLFLPMSLAWDARQKEALEKLRRKGCTLAFLGTPGIIPPQDSNLTPQEGPAAFTGLPLALTTRENSPIPCIKMDSPDGDWLPLDFPVRTFSGNSWCTAPDRGLMAWLKNAPDVLILGQYLDKATGTPMGMAAIGVKEGRDGEGHLFFSGITELPRELLLSLYRKAGVHQYVQTPDLVWASPDALAVCVNQGGVRRLHMPAQCRALADMVTGEVFPVDRENTAWIPFADCETRVFRVER